MEMKMDYVSVEEVYILFYFRLLMFFFDLVFDFFEWNEVQVIVICNVVYGWFFFLVLL